jgi:ABC-type nitrate/sulfonate/bicarbonate transport system ATPase subunit
VGAASRTPPLVADAGGGAPGRAPSGTAPTREVADVVLRVSGVTKHFIARDGSTLTAIDDVDLRIRRSEVVSLVGPSGCGKTTLLKMMVGLVTPDEGTIHLRDQRVDTVPDNIGFVFQEPALMPWKTVHKNVDIALQAKRMSKDERKAAVERYLALTGLADFGNYAPYQLSGGMQRRVALARGLVGSPDVLMLDEPFVALDALTRSGLQQELATIIHETGTTTVFVTHDVDEAVFLSDRVVVLTARPGRVQEIVDVPLERPRELKRVRSDPVAGALRDHIYDLIERS